MSAHDVLGSEPLGLLMFCENSVFGKHTRIKFSKGQHVIAYALDYIHFDLWGPASIQFLGENRCFLFVVVDHTMRVWNFTLRK